MALEGFTNMSSVPFLMIHLCLRASATTCAWRQSGSYCGYTDSEDKHNDTITDNITYECKAIQEKLYIQSTLCNIADVLTLKSGTVIVYAAYAD
jgi:hypothetical protein